MNINRLVALGLSVACMTGCASLVSSKSTPDQEKIHKGLTYYLPTQLLVLKLTVADARTVTVGPSDSMADTSSRFVAELALNELGTSKFDVHVGENGLLASTNTGGYTSQILEILKAIATDAGEIHGTRASSLGVRESGDEVARDIPDSCAAKGVYTWVFDPYDLPSPDAAAWKSCNIKGLSAKQLDGTELDHTEYKLPTGTLPWKSGFYYRQALPVRIELTDQTQPYVFLIPIVSKHSPMQFLPLPRGLFATRAWSVTFANGIPTEYQPDNGGEILGLVSLPATVLETYTTALTAGVTRRGTNQSQRDKMAVQDANHAICKAALADKNPDMEKVKSACNYP